MFPESVRQIFSHGGRSYDPLKVWRELVAHTGGDLNQILKDSRIDLKVSPDLFAKKVNAQHQLIRAARLVFSMPDISPEGDGVLEVEVWDTLNGFLSFFVGSGRTTGTSPTSATPMASVPPEPSPTRPMSPCC